MINIIENIEVFKKTLITLLTDSEINKKSLEKQVGELAKKENKKEFFSKALELFVHLSFEEEDAKKHWENIFANYDYFRKNFIRNVGLRVAMFDYFINLYQSINNPILVEFRFLQETEKLAMIDSLTGVFNRRYFDIAINRELKRVIRFDKILSILLIDIDNFKLINDEKGHQAGDKILIDLGSFLKENCREDDIICRYGGEEFVVILPETEADGVLSFASRIRKGIKQVGFFKENDITFSGGIATYPYDGKEASELIKNADKALYEAKFTGKDSVVKSEIEKRRYQRFNKSWKFYYQTIEDSFSKNTVKECYTEDVSLGGVCFEGEEDLRIDTLLLLDIKLPTEDDLIIVGQIAWQKKVSEDRYSYGVHFHDNSADKIRKMKKVLNGDYNYN